MNKTLLGAVLLLGVACGPQSVNDDAVTASTDQALTVDNGRELNGRELNGRELNGRELNGRELNGRELNGRELNGARLGGQTIRSATLAGSELILAGADGTTFGGASTVGAVLWDDGKLAVRIDGVQIDSPNLDVWRYTLSRRQGAGWAPLCGTDSGGAPVEAIPLAGRWDYRQGVAGGGDHLDDGSITFACEGAALAKCVEFGYAPWRTVQRCDASGACTEVSLADYHQACTRMVRADYCGDGRSYTRDGTPIDIYDGVGVQGDTEDWAFEAEWTPSGASCLAQPRLGNRTHLAHCARELRDDSCGAVSHFDRGILLMSEANPPSDREDP